MQIKSINYMLLLCYFNLIIGCASTGTAVQPSSPGSEASSSIRAPQLPEVLLITKPGISERGKIMSLDGDSIHFLPFPYWHVAADTINIHEIQSLELVKMKGGAGRSAAIGFTIAFFPLGLVSAIESEYDEDYRIGLWGSILVGAATSLIGLLIGASGKKRGKSYPNFSDYPDYKKFEVIKKIMGL